MLLLCVVTQPAEMLLDLGEGRLKTLWDHCCWLCRWDAVAQLQLVTDYLSVRRRHREARSSGLKERCFTIERHGVVKPGTRNLRHVVHEAVDGYRALVLVDRYCVLVEDWHLDLEFLE